MPRKRLAEMSRSERIRYKEREQQRERRYRRKMAMADTDHQPPAPISLHPVPSLQTPTDTGYLDYREGLKLQRLIEQRLTLADTDG